MLVHHCVVCMCLSSAFVRCPCRPSQQINNGSVTWLSWPVSYSSYLSTCSRRCSSSQQNRNNSSFTWVGTKRKRTSRSLSRNIRWFNNRMSYSNKGLLQWVGNPQLGNHRDRQPTQQPRHSQGALTILTLLNNTSSSFPPFSACIILIMIVMMNDSSSSSVRWSSPCVTGHCSIAAGCSSITPSLAAVADHVYHLYVTEAQLYRTSVQVPPVRSLTCPSGSMPSCGTPSTPHAVTMNNLFMIAATLFSLICLAGNSSKCSC